MLNHIFRAFTQPLRHSTGFVPNSSSRPLPSTSFPIQVLFTVFLSTSNTALYPYRTISHDRFLSRPLYKVYNHSPVQCYITYVIDKTTSNELMNQTGSILRSFIFTGIRGTGGMRWGLVPAL